jgi:hypothetical protein
VAILLFLTAYFAGSVATSLVAMRSGRSTALIAGDGIGYYAWLRSAAIDGDLDFRNDYTLLYPPNPLPPEMSRRTPRGLVPNKFSVGLAIVELPGFLAAHVVARSAGVSADGRTWPYQFAIITWLQLLCADPVVPAIVIASALCATNLLHYVAKDACMPHASGVALITLAFASTIAWRDQPTSRWAPALAGALLGLAVTVRLSNIALAPFFLAILSERTSIRRASALQAGCAFAAVVAVQVGLSTWFWSRFAVAGYESEGFTAGMAGVVNTLVSSRHGLFVYHPWYLGMLLLCVLALRRAETRVMATGALVSFAALAVINGTWWAWWFGDSYGNRSFIEVIPVLMIPVTLWLAAPTSAPRRSVLARVSVAALVLAGVNVVLWLGFLLRRYPANGEHSVRDAYLWMVR